MTILTILVIGGLVGWLAGRLMGHNQGMLVSMCIGIVGSLLGSFVSLLFVGSDESYLAFSWVGVAWAFIGSVLLFVIMNALTSRHHHRGI